MSSKDMIQHARDRNITKFGRAFKEAMSERIPAIVEKQRKEIAEKMFGGKR